MRLQHHPQTRIGFISPHNHNFSRTRNRVRLTAEGRLLLYLGNDHDLDMRALLRWHPLADPSVLEAVKTALKYKLERHGMRSFSGAFSRVVGLDAAHSRDLATSGYT